MNETGVHMLDQFKGSGKRWKFKIRQTCIDNFCSAAFRSRGTAAAAKAASLAITVAASALLLR